LWVEEKKQDENKKNDFFFFPTGQANLQVQEMLRRYVALTKNNKRRGTSGLNC
jgi:hypothetical protein